MEEKENKITQEELLKKIFADKKGSGRYGAFGNDDADDSEAGEDNNVVTKIYVNGTEYNSIEDLPPEVREKMSKTLLEVQQSSSKPEDMSQVFKHQRKPGTGLIYFGKPPEGYEGPSLNIGKVALVAILVASLVVVAYVFLLR